MLLPHLRYHAKFGHSRSDDTSVIMDICHKILTPTARFSRSLKVTGTDTYRSPTYCSADHRLCGSGELGGLCCTKAERLCLMCTVVASSEAMRGFLTAHRIKNEHLSFLLFHYKTLTSITCKCLLHTIHCVIGCVK